MFPFVLRTRILMVGRDALLRSKRDLHFVLVTRDLSAKSREEILSEFSEYPILEHYTSEELAAFFGLSGQKVVGFRKSTLAQSIYAELKDSRLNMPASKAESPREQPAGDSPVDEAKPKTGPRPSRS